MISKGMRNDMFQGSWFQYGHDHVKNHDDDDDHDEKCTSSSSIGEESNGSSSVSSCDLSTCDTRDDASSSSASSSFSSNCGGGLFDLSEIMEELPIKRGLSKFYKGKSESFTSLSRVTSIEDLAKKAISNRRNHINNNLKASKSIGTGLYSYKPYTLPKPIISKKSTRGSSFSSLTSKRVSFLSN